MGPATSLLDEIERYLAVVEAFRAEGHEPRWRPESRRPDVDEPRSLVRRTATT